MIGYLRGKVLAKNPETSQCVVRAHHVGYEVSLSATAFDRVLIGDRVELWIHTHVREDVFALYGFATETEKHFFRLLLGVSGLGPRSSLALLSEHGAQRLGEMIRRQDATALSSAPGIGKKTAQKIVLDLQSKIEKLSWFEFTATAASGTPKAAAPNQPQPLREDLASALLNLGFAPAQVKPTIERIFERDGAEKEGFESCLKLALKEMSGRVVEGAARG